MPVNVIDNAQDILDGAFLARAVYGGVAIDQAFNVGGDSEAERADDYRGYVESQGGWQLLSAGELTTFDGQGFAEFTSGGLYNARVDTGVTDSYDAQGLVAVEGTTLVMSFRGTDPKDPAVLSGQAFIGSSLAANYEAFAPMIAAAKDYLAAHPEIERVVVSGHSLGGAMADIFALTDAAEFRALRPDGVSIVSIASSGISPDLPQYLDGIDETLANIDNGVITSLTAPADYISFANDLDRAHFPGKFPDFPEALGLIPIVTLKNNVQFGTSVVMNTPNVKNTDVAYTDPFSHPLDFRGLGADHNASFYWANLQALVIDHLRDYYEGQNLIFGITDYRETPDWDGSPVALFDGYVDLDDTHNDWDQGKHSLVGTVHDDYILGMSGNDRLVGGKGDDLLSGGTGKDAIAGGDGADRMDGGAGRDTLSYEKSVAGVAVDLANETASGGLASGDAISGFENLIGGPGNDVLTGNAKANFLSGNAGNDILTGGGGGDRLTGGAGADTFVFLSIADSQVGAGHDTITDFTQADGDLIDLSAVAAFHLTGNDGSDGFTGQTGELHFAQLNGNTIVKGDVNGDGVADFEIVLKGLIALKDTDFIL